MGDVAGIKEDIWKCALLLSKQEVLRFSPVSAGCHRSHFNEEDGKNKKKKNKSRKAERFPHEGVKAGEGPTLKPPPAASCP